MLQAIITGLLMGGLYALIGVGLSLIFGIVKVTNIAHGDLMIVSTFFIMVIVTKIVNNIYLALAITIVVMAILGFLIQKFLINTVIDQGAETAMLVMFGLSIAIQNALTLIFGAGNNALPSPVKGTNFIKTDIVSISGQYAVNFIIAIVLIVGLALIMDKTPLGRSIRAASSDTMAAELMGINTKTMYVWAMAITMAATAVAGMLVGQTYSFFPYTGTQFLIIAFGVVVIGGMGSIFGTLLGGAILGLAQMIAAYLFGTAYQTLAGYIVLLILLTVRPQGLLSKKVRK